MHDLNKKELIASTWERLRAEAAEFSQQEPLLKSYYFSVVLQHQAFYQALAFQLSQKLASQYVGEQSLHQLFIEVCEHDSDLEFAAVMDMLACVERDPACNSHLKPLMYFKGYLAIQAQRFAHRLWSQGRKSLAYYLQSQSSKVFDADIHPAATLGYGLMFDHATGIVIGETAIVGNNVSMLHAVTLGGSGVTSGKRHPSIGEGALISVGAKILGAVDIGQGVRIGGGSVVLGSIPDNSTVVGVPARVVGSEAAEMPAFSMDQHVRI